VGDGAAVVVAMFGLLTLAEWISGRSLGIDQTFVRDVTHGAGRASPLTAAAFAFVAVAQMTLDAAGRSLRRLHVIAVGGFTLTVLCSPRWDICTAPGC
jgi:hypothetical protein